MLAVTRTRAAFPCGGARDLEQGVTRIDPLHRVFQLDDASSSQMTIPRRFQPRLAAGFDEATDANEAPPAGDAFGVLGDCSLAAVLAVLALIGVAAVVIAAAG